MMFIDVDSKEKPKVCVVVTWKEKFKRATYSRNQKSIQSIKVFFDPNNRECFRGIFFSEIENDAKEEILDCFGQNYQINDDEIKNYPHSYFSLYIPLGSSRKFQDQLSLYFFYFSKLKELDLKKKRNRCYDEISSYMLKAKNENANIFLAWQRCLNQYTCGLDILRRIQIYLEILKTGTVVMKAAYQKYWPFCIYDVFYLSIIHMKDYFKGRQNHLNRSIQSISVGRGEEINEHTIPNTMKMIFCPICMIYDCGKHVDGHSNFYHQHQFVSPENMHSQLEILGSALDLLQNYKLIFQDSKTNKRQQIPPCSKRCYRNLNPSLLKQIQKSQAKLASPLLRSFINLGIHMFMYSPCRIWPLVSSSPSTQICCDLVFLYLMEYYKISKRLTLKFQVDQKSFLLQQMVKKEGKPKKKKKQKTKKQQFYSKSEIGVCHHYFLDSQSIDERCQECICAQRGFCLSDCLCDLRYCTLRQGCQCHKGECKTSKCVCFSNNRECHPGICFSCYNFNDIKKQNECSNNEIHQNRKKLTRIGASTIPEAGLGLFAKDSISNGEFVCIYSGQIIDTQLEIFRQAQNRTMDFYNFANSEDIIDARFMGNKTRFINHGRKGADNLEAQVRLAKGTEMIAFVAKRDIESGQQLFFDYDGNGQLFKKMKSKYPFLRK